MTGLAMGQAEGLTGRGRGLPGSQRCPHGLGEGEMDPPGGREARGAALSAEEPGLGEAVVLGGIQAEVSGVGRSTAPWPSPLWGLPWSVGGRAGPPHLTRWPHERSSEVFVR